MKLVMWSACLALASHSISLATPPLSDLRSANAANLAALGNVRTTETLSITRTLFNTEAELLAKQIEQNAAAESYLLAQVAAAGVDAAGLDKAAAKLQQRHAKALSVVLARSIDDSATIKRTLTLSAEQRKSRCEDADQRNVDALGAPFGLVGHELTPFDKTVTRIVTPEQWVELRTRGAKLAAVRTPLAPYSSEWAPVEFGIVPDHWFTMPHAAVVSTSESGTVEPVLEVRASAGGPVTLRAIFSPQFGNRARRVEMFSADGADLIVKVDHEQFAQHASLWIPSASKTNLLAKDQFTVVTTRTVDTVQLGVALEPSLFTIPAEFTAEQIQ